MEACVVLGECLEEITSFTLLSSLFSVRVHVQFELHGSVFEVRAKRAELEHEQRREKIEA
jgi:hypothetical protein